MISLLFRENRETDRKNISIFLGEFSNHYVHVIFEILSFPFYTQGRSATDAKHPVPRLSPPTLQDIKVRLYWIPGKI